jgi:hypothetical protein
MTARHERAAACTFGGVALLLAGARPAWGHAEPVPADGGPALAATALVLVAALCLAALARRRARATALALALILGFVAFETAIHAAHHVAEPPGTVHCQLFAGTQHVTAALASVHDIGAPPAAPGTAPAPGPAPVLRDGFLPSDDERAPPAPLA